MLLSNKITSTSTPSCNDSSDTQETDAFLVPPKAVAQDPTLTPTLTATPGVTERRPRKPDKQSGKHDSRRAGEK